MVILVYDFQLPGGGEEVVYRLGSSQYLIVQVQGQDVLFFQPVADLTALAVSLDVLLRMALYINDVGRLRKVLVRICPDVVRRRWRRR